MKRTYFCLKCRATLNPDVKLILTMAKGKRRSLILLSPRPGDYSVILPQDVTLRRGDEVEFFCPACGCHLRSMVRRISLAPAGRESNALVRLLVPGCTVSPSVRRVILFT